MCLRYLSSAFSYSYTKRSKSYSKPIQISKTELFAKLVNNLKPLTTFQKRFIFDSALNAALSLPDVKYSEIT